MGDLAASAVTTPLEATRRCKGRLQGREGYPSRVASLASTSSMTDGGISPAKVAPGLCTLTMRIHHYPSDVTDSQWALIEAHIPVYPGGRPRKTDTRHVVDAVFYILRTGCQWRYLPRDFPPKSTVWRYFNEWRHDGTLDTIHDLLRRKVRTAEKPYHPRTSASIDSQSVDTTSGGEQRGRDNAKNVDGRKRHIVVDSMGLLLGVRKPSPNPFSRVDCTVDYAIGFGYKRPCHGRHACRPTSGHRADRVVRTGAATLS
jgi:transposase